MFLNPYDRDNRDLILNLYKEIITKYDIDGIHLDYIRFPEYNFNTYDYGYNEDIIEGFKEKYNTSLNPKSLTKGTEMHDKWCKFREDIINSWVEEIYNLVIHTKPGLWISAACYPDVENASKTIFQNVSDWVDNGWIDEVFSMTYSANNDYVIENAKLFENIVKDKAFYSVGISAFGTTNEYDFVTQLDIIRDIGADGSAIFSLGNITPENYGRFIVEGSYSKKSIQTYLLEKTVSTGLNDILHKLDVIYDFGNALFTSDITKKINEIISKSDNFNSSNSTIDQKFSYANKTIVDLNHLINIVNEYKINPEIDQEKLKAIEDDFRVLLRYITKTKNRLNARLT